MKIYETFLKVLGTTIILFINLSVVSAQKIEISGVFVDAVSGDPVPKVKCQAVDKYNNDVYATSFSDANGRFTLISPASERIVITAERANFSPAKWSFREISDRMFNMETNWPLTPIQVGIFDYRISFSKDSVQNIHLMIHEKGQNALILSDSIRHVKSGLKLRLKKDIRYEIRMAAKGRFMRRWELAYISPDRIILNDWLGQNEEHYTRLDTTSVVPVVNHQVRLTPVELNAIIEIKGIEYEIGDADLSKESSIALEKIVDIITMYPDLIFEIGNHSKDWGETNRNLAISIARAQTAVNYLVEKDDLHSFNISAKGYGSNQMPSFCPGKKKCENEKSLEPHSHSITTLKVIGSRSSFANDNRIELENKPSISATKKERIDRKITEKAVKKSNENLILNPRSDSKINFIPADFTGKAIQILYTSKLLPEGHPIFSEPGLLTDLKPIGGYSYLIPIPKGVKSSKFLKKYQRKYKDAFVVSYFGGERK